MIISVSTATHCLSSRHLPRTSMSGLTTKRTELVFSWMALWCTWTHHTAQPPARLGDLFECIFKKGRLRALSTENVLHILVENKNINMDLRIAFCLDPRTKMVFSMPGRFPFFHNPSKNNTWSPAYIGVVPVHVHINVTSCWIDLYLSFLCLRGQIMAICCILGCLWPVVIENLRYSSTYIVSYLLLKTILYVLGLT